MNKYNQIMDNVKVTKDMHNRIMNNISKKRFSKYKRYSAIVAGIALLLISSFLMTNLPNRSNENVTITSNIMSYENINELSEAIGFQVQDLEITAKTITYKSYFAELAEIVYETNENIITYRVSNDNEDNSGNYREYLDTKDIVLNSIKITLKGQEGLYNQAIWFDGTKSYSIYSEIPLKEDLLVKYINII